MKMEYNKPRMMIIFSDEDVITTSSETDYIDPGNDWYNPNTGSDIQ